jgi:Predicted transcriptional regulators
MKLTYDRLAVGDRLRKKRTLLDMTQDEMAEKINRAPKYYADIERGNCGMSIETLLALSDTLNMSLDYILFGDIEKERETIHTEETAAVMNLLDHCDEKDRNYAMRMLKLFLVACRKEGASGEFS